ncbi:MAG: hypothetical protein V3V96_13990 [Acidiferrobacterales bacterium]
MGAPNALLTLGGWQGRVEVMLPAWHDDRFAPALAVFAVIGCLVTLIVRWVVSWF